MPADKTQNAVRRIRNARDRPIEDRKFRAANVPALPAMSTDGIQSHVLKECREKRKEFQPRTRPPRSSATAPTAGNFEQAFSLGSGKCTEDFQRDSTVYMQSEFHLMRN